MSKEIPEVRDAMKKHHVTIGGFEVDVKTKRVVTVTTLDNLLKGAATQGMKQLLSFSYPISCCYLPFLSLPSPLLLYFRCDARLTDYCADEK